MKKGEVNEMRFDFSLCKELEKMTPAAYIAWMFEQTDGWNKALVPVWPWDDSTPNRAYLCTIRWTEEDRDRAIKDFAVLYETISGIAEHYYELSTLETVNAKILTPEQLKVYNKYLSCVCSPDTDSLAGKNSRRARALKSSASCVFYKLSMGTIVGRDVIRFAQETVLHAYAARVSKVLKIPGTDCWGFAAD